MSPKSKLFVEGIGRGLIQLLHTCLTSSSIRVELRSTIIFQTKVLEYADGTFRTGNSLKAVNEAFLRLNNQEITVEILKSNKQ